MLSVEDAARTVAERTARLPVELVPLHDARGRILAENITAARSLPSFDNSAMDGYAARSSELPATLPVVAQVAAGQALTDPIPQPVAIRILTGAPMPPALEPVLNQEDPTVHGPQVPLPNVTADQLRVSVDYRYRPGPSAAVPFTPGA